MDNFEKGIVDNWQYVDNFDLNLNAQIMHFTNAINKVELFQ